MLTFLLGYLFSMADYHARSVEDGLEFRKMRSSVHSCVWLLATPWTVAHWAPLTMGFSGQGYWSGFPFLSPGDVCDPGIKPASPAMTGGFFTTEAPGKPHLGKHGSVTMKRRVQRELTTLKGCCWTRKDAGILDLRRRRIQSGVRDEAWLLRAFV